MAKKDNDQSDNELADRLNVLIALSIKQILGEKGFSSKNRKRQGVSDVVHYLADMGLDAKDIAKIVGSPLTSVRTLLTPARRK